jgi:hypothetical protein
MTMQAIQSVQGTNAYQPIQSGHGAVAYGRPQQGPAYGTDGYTRNGQPTGPIKATNVVFLQTGPYASAQLVSLLRMAHEAAAAGDQMMAKAAYTKATYLAKQTDEFILVATHAASRNYHTTAQEALLAGKSATNDVNRILSLAGTAASLKYKAVTNDLYQTATASSFNFYQLSAISRHAANNGYADAARAANFKAISVAGR